MSSLPPARRRATRFDDAVSGTAAASGLDPELAALVELVGALRAAPQPAARPAFVADLRSSLLAAAETELAPTARPATEAATPSGDRPARAATTRRPRRERRLAAALGGLALVGATTTMAVAAQSALPGDVLYPVKRVIEDADTSLGAHDRRGNELLDHASVRLDELDQLGSSRWDGKRTEAAEDALTTFGDQATEASDLLIDDFETSGSESSITTLRDFTGQSIEELSALEAELPTSLRPALVAAAQVLVGIDQQAAELCPGCGQGILDLPTSLVSALLPPDAATSDEQVTADAEAPTGQLGAPTTAPSSAPTPKPTTAKPTTPPVTVPPLPVPTTPPVSKPPAVAPTSTPPQPTKSPGTTVDETVTGVTGVVNGLLGGVVGGLTGTTPTPVPPLPSLGQVLDGTLGTVGGLTGGLLDPPKK